MKFNNPKDAINWMINNPLKKLYDKYGNYYLFGPYSNVIEYNYEIDNENCIWDIDKINIEDFLKLDIFNNDFLEN